MTRKAAMPWQGWLSLTLCSLTCLATVCRGQVIGSRPSGDFRFTHSLYNGTIPENAVGKVYVKTPVKMGISLPDTSLLVSYAIVEGDESGIFHAESETQADFCFLRVRTKTGVYGRLNREHLHEYLLKIRASADHGAGLELEAFTHIHITLLDQNEFSPIFPSRPYNVSIREDLPVLSSLAVVKASDAELGINGEVYYSFLRPSLLFAVHPTSGVVTLMRSLKFQPRTHTLEIHAEDRGMKSSTRQDSPLSNTKLYITVLPVNYNPPVVLVHKFQSLVENATPGSVFAVLTITDDDVGVNGEIQRVDVVNNKLFRVVPTSTRNVFNVVVAGMLDREVEPASFNLTILAEDRGEPPKTATVFIPVVIQDINDNAPKFEKSLYHAELLEIVPVHTPVLFVKAVDPDEGQNGEVRYRLKDDEASKQFHIDEVFGLISTAQELDSEKQKQLILVVYAEDRASIGPHLTGETKVIIDLKDFNDNGPRFNMERLSNIYVSENMPKGTPVVTVSATDRDSGDNGHLSYSIQNVGSVPFVIDPFSGEITTTEVFDYETMRRQYTVIVRASDWGVPFRHWTQEKVVINVQDRNDNSPEFEKTRCKGYLSRDASVGTEIVVLTAIDFDAGNIISYSISEGNKDGCLSMESSTGSLHVNCDLSALPDDTRNVTVVASDGQHLSVPTTLSLKLVNSRRSQQAAVADVSVTCQDTDVTRRLQEQLKLSARNNDENNIHFNDRVPGSNSDMTGEHGPKFSDVIPATVTVSENAAVGTVVYRFSATDDDEMYTGQILYVISEGNVGGAFKMDTLTGDMAVLSPLDYETRSEYNLTLAVQDTGQARRTATRVVKVLVSDENDNAPQFEHTIYERSISEDVLVNSTVVQVLAYDVDTGLNAKVRYSLLSHGEDFQVEADSGVLKVRRPLDRERQARYSLLVQAQDSGLRRKLSATATVLITLSDVNDNFPECVPKTQTVRVREDLPVGTVVTTLTASDLDEGDNGRVNYRLVEGAEEHFGVDEVTGAVRIMQPLDYELRQVYNLSVQAKDNGQRSLSSVCLLHVLVVDVDENFHAPEFPHFLERGRVAENSPVGTYVMTVRAVDKDDPASSSGRITYSIHQGTGLGRFTIDANGTIRTSQVLDRETWPHLWLTVYAQDHGPVPQLGRLEVLVVVEDVNDHVPQFLEPAYYASVTEDTRLPQSVVKVQAWDGDSNPDQVLTFSITGGNPQGFFQIEPLTGVISTTNRVLDRETQEEHALEVSVTDNGSPQLSSTTRVVIKIIDINDNRPMFVDKIQQISLLPQTVQPGQHVFICRAVAFDKDEGPNAEITYSLRDQEDQFSIDSKSGEISSKRDLLPGQLFELVVRATDGGSERRRTQHKMKFLVMERPLPSGQAPRFRDRGLRESVMETDPPGLLITLLSVDDRPDIIFAIEGGNEDKALTIHPNHGSVMLARPVDWESRSAYNLTVSVTDGLHKDYTWLYVEVLDVNDHEPVFSHRWYRTNVSESVKVGQHVLRVSASDRDKDNRLFYSIASAASTGSLSKFQIDPLSGVIMVAEALDREEIQRHLLTIMVRDQGTPSKKSFARVEIDVMDDNDHVPKFLSKTFEGRIFETAAIGTAVVQVTAMDQDKGSNSELTYSILSGNADSTFSMDERLGMISLARQVERAAQEFHLVVLAVDQGTPPQSSTAAVKIIVTVSNNSPPSFLNDDIITGLQENQPSGTIVEVVSAESQSTVVYTILNGNQDGCFFLNPNSAVLTTSMPLDFERHQLFNLTILATNIVGATTTATVLIHVDDQNDNQPVFLSPVFYGNITESAEPNSMVYTANGSPLVIRATDADSGDNSLLEYEIVESEARKFFSIDPSTGAVQIVSSVDHELTPKFNFSVQVRDRGSPRLSAKTPAQVFISVTDINDTPPRFTQHAYVAKVLLPTYSDVSVVTVQASDPDTVNSMALTYSIVDGNHGNVFAINPQSGVLYVEQSRNIQDHYELKVQASDGRFDTVTRVVISVETSTDSGLRFSKEHYFAHVVENDPTVQSLAVIQPLPMAVEQYLTFRLLNNLEHFTMGFTSGVLQTKGLPLDREQKQNYTVVVEVVEGIEEPRTAHVVVVITVEDVNDNAPVFVKQPFTSVVTTHANQGDVIRRVTATDADSGENGELRYFLPADLTDNGRDAFAINQYNGDIVVKHLTVDDHKSHFVLTVEAVDRGNPPMSSKVEIPIDIVDGSSPLFEIQQKEVRIPENAPVYSPVVSVQATSPKGQKLLYSITHGDRYSDFEVDFNTDMEVVGPCLVSILGQLDRESQAEYNLTIRASDISSASYTEMRLNIIVEDVNDNAPIFESMRYTSTVSERVRVGFSILQVTAQDADEGANGLIHYSLAPMSPDSRDTEPFFINSETGIILLHRLLDREKHEEYVMTVVATDSGVPARSTSAIVRIIILDYNDNAPIFLQPSFSCYITEQAKRGQLVTKVMAVDADSSDAGKLSYAIIGGNEKQAFAMDPITGIITVSEHRRPDFSPAYFLNVSVTDGVFTSYAHVTINIRNTNQHAPRFTEKQYYVEVSELSALGTSVITVSATDGDRGNYGMLTYSLPSQHISSFFSIDADSGEIITKKLLDREMQSQFEFTVAATDDGGQMGFTTVTVVVTDDNDNMPQFVMDEYKANVHPNASVNTKIIQVKAEDEDLGDNGRVTYTLHGPEDNSIAEMFSIEEESGFIIVRSSLLLSANKVFQFFVRARDHGSTPLENHVPVEIFVTGTNDTPPVFPEVQRSFFIQEDEPAGAVIATLKAKSDLPVSYSIVPGMSDSSNRRSMFVVNDDGELRILRELNREKRAAYTLSIRAQTRSSPPLFAYMTVSVQLRDINDEVPEFESIPYLASVVENADIGTSVIQVKAVDADVLRRLEYSFGPGMEEMANIFAVDANTGWITLLSRLDRERVSEYNLTLMVTDTDDENRINGPSVRLSSVTSVIIAVTDYNDNAPRFSKTEMSTAVNEGALPDTAILSLSSTDADVGLNADVTYYIIQGDPLGQFYIRSNGEMIVSKGLDRETQGRFTLQVAATDGGFITVSEVTVIVLDDNDNAPECAEPFLDVMENEDVAVGKALAQVRATDRDEPATANSRLEYTLAGNGSEKFHIVKETGVLHTAMRLDRETKQEYLLTATVTDGGGLSCVTEIRIFLRDINDNPPEFTGNFRETLTIQEDAKVNTLLTRVTTVDRDTGINRNTAYRLLDVPGSMFSIDPKSGILSLVRELDRELQSEYSVTVVAYNEISPELSATVILRVVVLDVNDNPPTFERTSYYTAVSEGARVGDVVVQVRATSLDIGPNAAITYTIAAGNQQGKFTLGAKDGILSVAEPLDHELSREYFLTVLARDHGSPPLSNTAIISINISDINDNAPRFSKDMYQATVSEAASVGTKVYQVMATDVDSYANSVITYSIIDGNFGSHFLIGPHDGIITIANPLDRETRERCLLTIHARDSGSPMLFSTAVVSVNVEDANDNPPVFDRANYSTQVQEGRRTGIEIMKFVVIDRDKPENGPPFTFDIIGGNSEGEFHVDSNGVLFTAGKLSKQVKEQYQLTVRVFDNGSPPLHSDTRVVVHVVDDSMYPPDVRNLSIYIGSCMDAFTGGVIGQIEAHDRDPYDTLSFNIVSPNRHLFDVNRDDGRLIALTGLDEGEYVVNVSITDQKFTQFARVMVTAVCISNDVIENAITIQFGNMIPEQFYATYKRDFQRIMKQNLNVRLTDVEIINVQPAVETIAATNSYRPKRSTSSNDLDVLFAVRKSPDRFYSRRSLKRKVQKFADQLAIDLGVRVLKVFSDLCAKSMCEAGTCMGSVTLDHTQLVPVVVNGESFVSPRHLYTHQCVCMDGQCPVLFCGEERCQTYEVCGRDAFGEPVCQCPEGRNGVQCQNIIPLCSGSKCPVERPMTFSGRSYAKWTLGHTTQKRMSLSLRFRTRQASAILMYAKGQVDYSILAIEEGSLVYRFNCGSGEGQVWVPIALSDGQWHRVTVERIGRVAEIMLDDQYTAMGTAPGIHDILNLDEEEVFFGAKVDVLRNGYRDISKGFEGCMEDIRMFNVPLPLTGANDIAASAEFEIVEFHCKDTSARVPSPGPLSNICSSSPCLNGGVCQFSGLNSYMCVCRGRFKGPKCELDSDPCQDLPCLNQGQCKVDTEVPNSYTCRCPGNLLGMRCTYGFKCRPNPCLNAGTCVEGPTSALCHCAPGFAGLYCDKNVDACDSAPCLNGGSCLGASGGRYACNCSSLFSGRNCEDIIQAHITSSTSGISAEEIYGIIAVVAVIILFVMIFVSWRIWRRRKRNRRRRQIAADIADGSSELMLNGLMKDTSSDFKRKASNPDLTVPVHNIPSQPPPVPNRPASYTPSTHDSLNVLNNLDSVRNYGSAADDLETVGTRQHIPDYTEYLASLAAQYPPSRSHSRPSQSSTLPPPPPSSPPSDSDSLQKAPWEFEYPNILGSYDDDKHRVNLAKRMPGLNSPIVSSRPVTRSGAGNPDACSVSSLPVSESEDDLNGYHWDTSDWAPHPSLPNISEIPANEVADSPSSSDPPSCDSNERVPSLSPSAAATTPNGMTTSISAIPDPDYMTDSEYVGETENEFEFDDREDGLLPPPGYADLPSYDQLLSMRALSESYELPPNLSIHPDQYLPYYRSNFDGESLGSGIKGEEDAGNLSDEQNSQVDAALAADVAERSARRQPPGRVFLSPGYVTSGEYATDVEPPSRASMIDDMSMSVGGYTSNASCSDISGLCEIEDSEINASEDDLDDESSPCLPSHLHTEV